MYSNEQAIERRMLWNFEFKCWIFLLLKFQIYLAFGKLKKKFVLKRTSPLEDNSIKKRGRRPGGKAASSLTIARVEVDALKGKQSITLESIVVLRCEKLINFIICLQCQSEGDHESLPPKKLKIGRIVSLFSVTNVAKFSKALVHFALIK